MAIYGISFYGTTTYGAPPFLEVQALKFDAQPRGYTQAALAWGNPGSVGSTEWDALRLVRSSYGAPVSLVDGVTLFEDPQPSARTSYVDSGLAPGRFYYYTLFVRLVSDGLWRPSASTQVLITQDFQYGNRLLSSLPGLYASRDVAYGSPGPLQRFLNLLGYQYDLLRTELETLREVANIDVVSGTLLPVVAASLGVSYEPELGQKISRSIIRNAVYASKVKGTVRGIEAVASAYSGYGASAVIGRNLLLDYNDSGFKESLGHWYASQNATITRTLSNAVTPPLAGENMMTLTAGSGGIDSVALSGQGLTCIPVEAGKTYTASTYVRTAVTARSVEVSLVFYDASWNVLTTLTNTAADTTSWVRRSVTGTAPANTRWAAQRVVVLAPANGEVHRFAAMQVEEGSTATAYEPAREIHVYLDAVRTNLATNPSLEVDATGWAASTNTTVARTTGTTASSEFLPTFTADFPGGSSEAAAVGSGSLRAVATAAGVVRVTYGLTAVDEVAPYTASVMIRPDQSPARLVTLSIEWLNVSNAVISTTTGTSRQQAAFAWTRPHVFGAAPSGATNMRVVVTVDGAAADDAYLIDALLIERSEFLNPYFDASMAPIADHLWGGTAHASESHFYPGRAIRDHRLRLVLPDHTPAGSTFDTHYGLSVPVA